MRGSASLSPSPMSPLWVLSWRNKKVPPPAGITRRRVAADSSCNVRLFSSVQLLGDGTAFRNCVISRRRIAADNPCKMHLLSFLHRLGDGTGFQLCVIFSDRIAGVEKSSQYRTKNMVKFLLFAKVKLLVIRAVKFGLSAQVKLSLPKGQA